MYIYIYIYIYIDILTYIAPSHVPRNFFGPILRLHRQEAPPLYPRAPRPRLFNDKLLLYTPHSSECQSLSARAPCRPLFNLAVLSLLRPSQVRVWADGSSRLILPGVEGV